MRLALLAITAVSLFGQSFEIRGTVTEPSGAGLAGIELTLTPYFPGQEVRYQQVLATTYSDARGAFSFRPETIGQYRVEVKKAGYITERGVNLVFLSAQRPAQEIRFTMIVPGGITGRFVDEQDKPIEGLYVLLEAPPQERLGVLRSVRDVRTDADGNFAAEAIVPGSYVIRAVKSRHDPPRIADYSDEAFQLTDRAYENLVWPTGVPDPRDAVPLIVPPGATASLGTIRLREIERYRVRVNVQGDCSGSTWSFAVLNLPQPAGTDVIRQRLECKNQLLLSNIPPGSYEFALWNDEEPIRWARAPLVVTRSNTTLNLTLSPATDVPGRIVVSAGVKPPPDTPFALMMSPEIGSLSQGDAQQPQVQPDGTFVARSLRWDRYRVTVGRVPAPYYVREIRYAGHTLSESSIALIPGAQLEIELDDKPARVNGTILKGEQPFIGPAGVAVVKLPFETASLNGLNSFVSSAETQNGQFEVTGLAPGEYRIAAVSIDTLASLGSRTQFEQMVQNGEKFTLERGQQKSMQVKLSTVK